VRDPVPVDIVVIGDGEPQTAAPSPAHAVLGLPTRVRRLKDVADDRQIAKGLAVSITQVDVTVAVLGPLAAVHDGVVLDEDVLNGIARVGRGYVDPVELSPADEV